MTHLPDESKLKFSFGGTLRTVSLGLIVLGLILIAVQFVLPWQGQQSHHGGAEHAAGEVAAAAHAFENPRLFMSLHLGLLLAIPLAIGGIYFVSINHLAGSAWNVTVRRLAESYFWFIPFVLVLMLVVLLNMGQVFSHWVGADLTKDHLLAGKSPWLSESFFLIRNVVILLIWGLFGFIFWRHSTRQDESGDVNITRKMVRLSSMFLVFFGLSYSASSWDLSMSLEPHWFSTMWAVYLFAGFALTTYSSLIIWVWYLKRAGYYGDTLNENHIHDLGKYMWGHTIFWTYIAASQFLLIWYAHIPEETIFFRYRIYTEEFGLNAWAIISMLLVLIRFLLPFFLIIKREAKRNLNYLAAISVIVFIGQIVDMYWIAYPTMTHSREFVMFSWYELGPIFLVIGAFIFSVGIGFSRVSMIPKKDPRLEECLHWHQ